ncbi:MAG: hypothetical protein U0S48_06645 [Solirubrobacteraceae bacterium]
MLEIGDSRYTRQFGRAVASADVLHAVAGNPQATIVGDLADPPRSAAAASTPSS